MKVYERIKYLRKEVLHQTQEEFASAINVSRSNLGSIEIGRVSVTDRVLSDISEKYRINKEWLAEGTGEIFIKLNRQQELAKLTTMLFKEEEDSFKNRLIMALANLEPDEWELLEKIAISTVNKKD